LARILRQPGLIVILSESAAADESKDLRLLFASFKKNTTVPHPSRLLGWVGYDEAPVPILMSS